MRRFGSLDHWIIGSLDHWIIGSLDHWIIGSLDHWIIGSLEVNDMRDIFDDLAIHCIKFIYYVNDITSKDDIIYTTPLCFMILNINMCVYPLIATICKLI
jgi:hypothetical protein